MVKILGAAGSYSHESKATSFLINNTIAIDAGNIIQSMGVKCCELEHIFISHTHYDHIVDLPFVIESYLECREKPLKVYALSENIDKLKEYLFNWSIWPDFETITDESNNEALLQFIPVTYEETVHIDDVEITILKSNHTVPTCGFKIQKSDQAFIISGDTYINDALIDLINNDKNISSLLIDVSFSSDKDELAHKSKHLTPKLLEKMLMQLDRDDVEIYTYHQKPLFREKIDSELSTLNIFKNGGKRLETGDVVDFFTPVNERQHIRNFELGADEKKHLINLFKISQKMQTELDTALLLEMIVEQAKVFTHADGATLYLLSYNKKELVFKVSHNDTLNIHIDSLHDATKWPNLPLYLDDMQPNTQMVSVLSALNKESIVIPDVYDTSNFDFTGTKSFDKTTGYRSKSMLVVPLLNYENEVIGVLQLINKQNVYGEILPFDAFDEESTKALASQASVAIVNSRLINELEKSFELFIATIAKAINTRSDHTGEHVRKVSIIADMIAMAIHNSDKGIYKDVHYTEEDLHQIHMAALVHDVGKISTPEYLMEKSKKLEIPFDRIALIDERIEILKRDVEIKNLERELQALKNGQSLPTELHEEERKELTDLDEIKKFLHEINFGGEYLEDDKVSKLQMLAQKTYLLNGEEVHFLRDDELENLSIRRGTLNDKERDIIRNHADVTVDILNAIKFPKRLKEVPDIACNHHEKLDGTGYPRQLNADQLTLEDRIMILADMFEALSASNRTYRSANSMTEIATILQDFIDQGDMDKDLVEFFFRSGTYRKYAKRELNPEQQDIIEF